MSDPRFSRLKTDPRFRRPRKQQSKVVVDDRFKEIFKDGPKKAKKGRVDKYGRPISDTHEADNLRRFYRLENEEEEPKSMPDYARGEVTLESSDEEEDAKDDSDDDGVVTFGLDHSQPIVVPRDNEEAEINLDESNFADLDAQAAAYNKLLAENEQPQTEGNQTRRLAVVNLDWDHVRAVHLYKIFSSLVSPTAAAASTSSSIHPDRQRSIKSATSTVSRGRVLNVRVYPSEFGKERLAREEEEGPPPEIFKKREGFSNEDEVSEKNIYEVGEGENVDEDALRKYQLERLRYYYAVVTCDTVEAASHIYTELDGTELERSANVFDLSFVPDDMTFDSECRDEVSEDSGIGYKGVDFVTDALRHSKVKLTWDEDDPERKQVTRRALTRQEIEEADFRAYIVSSSSESESEDAQKRKIKDKKASRDKLRALLLGGNNEQLPEGWGGDVDDGGSDIDMEITFTPGLSEAKENRDETTLEAYQRKVKEKRKKRKEELQEKPSEKRPALDDDFFAGASDDGDNEDAPVSQNDRNKKKKDKVKSSLEPESRSLATPEELALLAASDNSNHEPKHFNLKSVIKAEKAKGRKGKGKKTKQFEEDQELQEDFAINVQDDRFKAVHDDHTFAIDPSHPHFKKTKSMSALLEERSKRQRGKHNDGEDILEKASGSTDRHGSLQSLVESVKRKTLASHHQRSGKRLKL